MKRLTLSNSRLNLYAECPRCFWLDVNAGIKRPDTLFPSLPGGLDLHFKRHFDRYRALGTLPPEVDGQLRGKLLPDLKRIEQWRDWRRGVRYSPEWTDVDLMGALDECLVDEEGYYYPLDYKTRGYAPKADSHAYYTNQLNFYTLLLEGNGHKTRRLAYLIYYHPVEVGEHGLIRFQVSVQRVPTDPAASERLVKAAVTLLQSHAPPSGGECGFCRWNGLILAWSARMEPRLFS